jgi:hypothetical protein
VLDACSSPLARYLAAATLARAADAGAAVGLVLLAVSPAAGVHHGVGTGGLLAAALTAPHLLGPWVARRLDGARDGRSVLAAAFAAYGVALAAASLGLGRVPLAFVVLAVGAAGACGPLLTGGLSSRLAGIAGSGRRARVTDTAASGREAGPAGDNTASGRREDPAGAASGRQEDPAGDAGSGRAEGWDAVTYGLAGTLGPALVAVLASATTPLVALLTLAAAAVVAAAVTLTLPPAEPHAAAAQDALTVRAALRLLVARGPLRRVGLATMLTAASFGALPVVAVMLGPDLTSRASAGASLVAAFGLGNLAGSGLVTAFPLRGEPERLTTRWVAVMGAALGLCAFSPSYPLALAAFVLAGASNAPFFTATLAARSRYSPARARAQVFVSLAGMKVAMASAGTALAGAASGAGPRVLLAAGAALTLGAAAATVLDRRHRPLAQADFQSPNTTPWGSAA